MTDKCYNLSDLQIILVRRLGRKFSTPYNKIKIRKLPLVARTYNIICNNDNFIKALETENIFPCTYI